MNVLYGSKAISNEGQLKGKVPIYAKLIIPDDLDISNKSDQ